MLCPVIWVQCAINQLNRYIMKQKDFTRAIELVSMNHTTKLTINQPINNFVGKLGESDWTIHITQCVPAVVSRLIEEGYSLSMTEHGLHVNKY